ncbi:hypothetical protein [Chthonobacter rhizosphaerae]|uniref:hypothetical protein n=1 Tax=Chthonobacter rhizosphaerae TaxID=2735553 RepID=UPI0015EF70B9|nr:hypothetical protein [Chthonobacter rhizosphaerae]
MGRRGRGVMTTVARITGRRSGRGEANAVFRVFAERLERRVSAGPGRTGRARPAGGPGGGR